MKTSLLILGTLFAVSVCTSHSFAQEDTSSEVVPADEQSSENSSDVSEGIDKAVSGTKEAIDDISKKVDSNEQAKEFSAGILKPIYVVAEALSFPAFHWIAFAVMATGVVSYALQLVLGKLVVLANMGFSVSEILSDALGLVISLVGLVLTTQAAVENSTFTSSPAAVLSASVVGLIAGFIFYTWGQRQEVEAAKGRVAESRKEGKHARKL